MNAPLTSPTAALFAAISAGDSDGVRRALADGADVSRAGPEAAVYGVLNADIHILTALHAAGLPWSSPYATGEGPADVMPLVDALFCLAVQRVTTTAIVRFLASHGADRARTIGERPLLLCFVRRAVDVDLEVLDALLAVGLPVNAADTRGETALMHAAGRGGENAAAACERLLAAGADPRARDGRGRTALEWAATAWEFSALSVLRRSGAGEAPPELRALDPIPEALRAPAGSFWVLSPAGDPPCLRWEATAESAAAALAFVEQRFGSSRERIGPFPIVRLVEVGPAEPLADPGAVQHLCEVHLGDLLVLTLLGVETPRAGDTPDPNGAQARLVVGGRFAATPPDAALACARGARGWSAVVCVESLAEMMDGYPYALATWRTEPMPAAPSAGSRS